MEIGGFIEKDHEGKFYIHWKALNILAFCVNLLRKL